ncbi:MAG: hypothetical protein ACI4QO_02990, partial [Clostridia bacterium]
MISNNIAPFFPNVKEICYKEFILYRNYFYNIFRPQKRPKTFWGRKPLLKGGSEFVSLDFTADGFGQILPEYDDS